MKFFETSKYSHFKKINLYFTKMDCNNWSIDFIYIVYFYFNFEFNFILSNLIILLGAY